MIASELFRQWVHDNAPRYSPIKGGYKRCGELCQELTERLSGMLANSCGVARPDKPRTNNFKLGMNHGTVEPKRREGQAERALWKHWSANGMMSSAAAPLASIQSFQVPLKPPSAKDVKPKLGKIDLLGSTHDDLPVVIELKVGKGDGDNQDAIFHAWIEALAYTLTLRFYWRFGLWKEWNTHTGRQHAPDSLAGRKTPIIIMADETFWSRRRLWTEGFWDNLQHLCQILKGAGLPVFAAHFHDDNSIVIAHWEKLAISRTYPQENRSPVVWPTKCQHAGLKGVCGL